MAAVACEACTKHTPFATCELATISSIVSVRSISSYFSLVDRVIDLAKFFICFHDAPELGKTGYMPFEE
jgi:hypothetical protein